MVGLPRGRGLGSLLCCPRGQQAPRGRNYCSGTASSLAQDRCVALGNPTPSLGSSIPCSLGVHPLGGREGSLPQQIFPTQELNQGLLHCRWKGSRLGSKKASKQGRRWPSVGLKKGIPEGLTECGVSREVPCSALKCETGPDRLPS